MSHISITNIDVNATQHVTQTEQKLKKRRTLGQASVAGRTHAMRHASHSHRPAAAKPKARIKGGNTQPTTCLSSGSWLRICDEGYRARFFRPRD
jgi:hypothetical protein